jgi:hypothetical protein
VRTRRVADRKTWYEEAAILEEVAYRHGRDQRPDRRRHPDRPRGR